MTSGIAVQETTLHERAGLLASPTLPLSLQLRERTAEAHREVERRLGLPRAICTLAQYRECLGRFYGFYRPLEESLRQFGDWLDWGIDLPGRAHAPSLAADLKALGSGDSSTAWHEFEPAPDGCLPPLPDFAHALGALYLVEGSTLGSQFILRHVAEVLGEEIAGADGFFRGYGSQTGARWGEMCASLDRFGRERPDEAPNVVEGATRTFRAIGDWMKP